MADRERSSRSSRLAHRSSIVARGPDESGGVLLAAKRGEQAPEEYQAAAVRSPRLKSCPSGRPLHSRPWNAQKKRPRSSERSSPTIVTGTHWSTAS